jgi:hypothetical protein
MKQRYIEGKSVISERDPLASRDHVQFEKRFFPPGASAR